MYDRFVMRAYISLKPTTFVSIPVGSSFGNNQMLYQASRCILWWLLLHYIYDHSVSCSKTISMFLLCFMVGFSLCLCHTICVSCVGRFVRFLPCNPYLPRSRITSIHVGGIHRKGLGIWITPKWFINHRAPDTNRIPKWFWSWSHSQPVCSTLRQDASSPKWPFVIFCWS